MLRRTSNNILGIIAEDYSDVTSLLALAKLIVGKNNLSHYDFVGRGSGRLVRKCYDWSVLLKKKGCSLLIVIHDSDGPDAEPVFQKVKNALKDCPIKNHIISIPVQELEAWFLSDPEAIRKALRLKKELKIKQAPENIDSPKEFLASTVRRMDKTKVYLNTVHNEKIANLMSLKKILEKCPSFSVFHKFIEKNL